MAAGRMKQRGVIPISLLLYAGAALAIMAALAYAYHTVKESGRAEIRLEWSEANRVQRQKEAEQIAKAAKELEDERAKRKVVYRNITRTVDKVVERPVYRNVCLDDDGLRCLDAALKGESAAGCKPDQPLPATGKPDGKGR